MTDDRTRPSLTADIVSAFLQGNHVAIGELPALIQSVSQTLCTLGEPLVSAPTVLALPSAARIRGSIKPDGIVSFEDGKSYKQIKRHLSSMGMSPVDYRTKWGLPKDYPMVSANYSAKRSELAKANGLGQNRARALPSASARPLETVASPPAAVDPPKARIVGRLGLFGRRKPAS